MRTIKIKNHLIEAPVKTILDKLKGELTNGKLRYIENKTNGWIRVTCPHHSNGLEEHASCGVYDGDDTTKEKGLVHCFTCDFCGPLYHFVGECFDKDDEFGKKWLIDNFSVRELTDIPKLNYININKEKKPLTTISKDVINNLQSWHPYMAKRKLSKDICEKFEIKYDTKDECIVFPVYDEKDNLVMLTRRSVNSKNFYIDKEKEKPVYLLNYLRKNNIKEAIVCESQINALTAWTWGYPAIATFGCNITKHQFDLLNASDINHYYLAFDGDTAGIKGTKRFLKYIRNDVFVDIFEIPKGKDLNDLTEEEFNNLKIFNKLQWLNKNKCII